MLEYEKLHFSEEKVEKKYLILSLDKINKTIGYQINLINNELSSLLGITLKNSKNNLNILYDVTDKITLEKYLKFRTVQVGEFSRIMLSILAGIKKTNKYSFNDSNFVIRPESIYFDRNSDEIYLLYIPIEDLLENNLEEQFKFLVKKLVVDIITIQNNENDNFITNILNLLRDETYDLLKLESFLSKYSKEANKKVLVEEMPYTKLERVEKISYEKKSNFEEDNNEGEKEKNPVLTQISEASELLNPKTEMIMSSIKESEKSENRYTSEMIDKPKKQNSRWNIKYSISLGVIQIVVITCTILEILLLDSVSDHIKFGTIAVMWIIDILIIVILTFCRLRNNSIYRLNGRGRETSALNFTNKNTEGIDYKVQDSNKNNTTSDSNSSRNRGLPYLLVNKAGIIEKVYINKDVFRIGRSTELVDYVSDNRAIGKIHAEIRKINSDYYIIDLDSKNGTFINNQRLEAQEMYKIKENDAIKLANSCYTFKLN